MQSSIQCEMQMFYHFRWRCSSSHARIDHTEVPPRDCGTGTDQWRHTGLLRRCWSCQTGNSCTLKTNSSNEEAPKMLTTCVYLACTPSVPTATPVIAYDSCIHCLSRTAFQRLFSKYILGLADAPQCPSSICSGRKCFSVFLLLDCPLIFLLSTFSQLHYVIQKSVLSSENYCH